MTDQTPPANHMLLRDWLPLYITGSLPPNERAAVEDHLMTCAECRALVDQWQHIAEIVRTDSAGRADRLPALNRALFVSPKPAKERNLNMTTQTLSAKPRSHVSSILGLAALFVLLAGLLTLFRQTSNAPVFGGQQQIALLDSSPTATATATLPISTPEMAGRPIPVSAATVTALAYTTPLTAGKVTAGQLTTVYPQAIYQFTALEAGLLELNAGSNDFKTHVSFYQLDANPVTVSQGGLMLSTDVSVYAHVHKGQKIGIMISSGSELELGKFTVWAAILQPVPLTYNQPVAQTFPTELNVFTFDAKAGDILDVHVKSDGNADLNMYLQSYTSKNTNIPIFNSSVRHSCIDTILWQQCFDDDSGGGTDPELNHIVVREDKHFEVIVSGFGLVNQNAKYQITVSKTTPVSLDSGKDLFTSLSWKWPTLPIVMNAQKGKSIQLDVKEVDRTKSPLVLTAYQDGQPLAHTTLNFDSATDPVTPNLFRINPLSDTPVLLLIEYVQAPIDGTLTVLTIHRE